LFGTKLIDIYDWMVCGAKVSYSFLKGNGVDKVNC